MDETSINGPRLGEIVDAYSTVMRHVEPVLRDHDLFPWSATPESEAELREIVSGALDGKDLPLSELDWVEMIVVHLTREPQVQ